ncbi:MAG: hypothetical protein EOP34_05955, partial [Rickettsiales bacterium]
ELTEIGLQEAQIIYNQLIETATAIMPIAGLAAPQIGISKQIFIYSIDKGGYNMTEAINPSIIRSGDKKISDWEACLSAISQDGKIDAAYLERPYHIEVEYLNLKGEIIRKSFEGWEAKLFQHEFDHLQGTLNIYKEGAIRKTFDNIESLKEHVRNMGESDNHIQHEDL